MNNLRDVGRYTSIFSATLSPCSHSFHHCYCTHLCVDTFKIFSLLLVHKKLLKKLLKYVTWKYLLFECLF